MGLINDFALFVKSPSNGETWEAVEDSSTKPDDRLKELFMAVNYTLRAANVTLEGPANPRISSLLENLDCELTEAV